MMSRMLRPLRLPLFAAVSLSGCALLQTEPTPTPEPATEQAPLATHPAAEPAPAPATSLAQIVQLLENGAFGQARRELKSYLGKHPDDSAARSLLIQVSVDAKKMLGEEHTLHTVARGETLSQIAREHLGSGMAFVILARYNDIAKPREIEVGQTIRIPSKPLSDVLTPGITVTTPPAPPAPPAPDDDGTWPPPADLPPPQLGARYQARIQSLLQAQRFDEAVATANLAASAQPAPGDWPWLPTLTRKAQSLRWQQLGLTRMQGNDLNDHLAAYDAFGEALALDPSLDLARSGREQLRAQLVLDYHEAALVQYRNQRLDAAVALWDKALALDPAFEPAQGYRLRALELKRRLQNLQSTKRPAQP